MSKEKTLAEAIRLKNQAEDQIRTILFDFGKKTGLAVEGVSFAMTVNQTFNDSTVTITSVSLDVRLP